MNPLARRLGIRRWTDVAWLVGSSAWVLLSIGFLLRAEVLYPLLDGNDPVYIRNGGPLDGHRKRRHVADAENNLYG